MNNILEIKNLEKSYDKFKLGEINLEIPKGAIVGLVGENGAGKTTLIKAILNIIRPDKGSIKIFGEDSKSQDVLQDIGVVLDNMFFPEILRIKDIDIIMKGIFKNWDTNLFDKYLKDFELNKKMVIKTLSKGMKKKLEIATALAHHPKFLILDEPTSGLDPVVRGEVLDIFLDFIQDENNCILLSTHITSDLEHIADKIVFIHEGKVVLDKTRDDIVDNYGILKCSRDDFEKIQRSDILAFKKNRYDYEVLIDNKEKMQKKYKDFVIDKITIEDLMILMIKGERIC